MNTQPNSPNFRPDKGEELISSQTPFWGRLNYADSRIVSKLGAHRFRPMAYKPYAKRLSGKNP